MKKNNVKIPDFYPYSETRRAFSVLSAGLIALRFVQEIGAYSFITLFGTLFPSFRESDVFVWFVSYFPFYFIAIPVYILAVSSLPRYVRTEKETVRKSNLFKLLAGCYALLYAGSVIGSVVNSLITLLTGTEVKNTVSEMLDRTGFWISLVVVGLLAPFFEELVFRKVMIDRMSLYGEKTAVLLSAFLFGAFHGNFTQFFYAFFIGTVFGYVYLRTGKLRYSFFLHAFINTYSVVQSEVLKLADIETLDKLESGNAEGLSGWFSRSAGWTALLGAMSLFSIAAAVCGLIFLIRHRDRVFFNRTEWELPKGKAFYAVATSVGVLIFVLYTVLQFIANITG